MGSETQQILMIPFLAHGHFRPYVELAKRLSTRTSFTFTFLTTPLNAKFLRQQLQTKLYPTIQISELPFNSSDHGLPPNIENLGDLPFTTTHYISFLNATTTLEPDLRHFLSLLHRPPLCIIYDHFMAWVAPLADAFGSFGVSFHPSSAYGGAAYHSVWTHLPHRDFSDDQLFPLPGLPENHRFHHSQVHRGIRVADGSDPASRFFQTQFKLLDKSSGWIFNSVEEVETLGLEIFRNYVKLPVWPMGPLVSTSSHDNENECIKWLRENKPDSVLYISFGSGNTISPTQMMELANGLELSGKPFLWVIKPPIGFDTNGEFLPAKWLPEGFEERITKTNQGILVHKWGPQLEILSHESVGAFLTHCGWNSVLEGLREGVPLIGWPLAAEQAFSSKMMVEEMGVAMELARGVDGEVSKEDVKRVVETVLEREEGSCGWEMKKKAAEMKKNIKDALREEGQCKGSSIRAMDDFLDTILSFRETTGI